MAKLARRMPADQMSKRRGRPPRYARESPWQRPALDLDSLPGLTLEQLLDLCSKHRISERGTLRTLQDERGLSRPEARAAFEAWLALPAPEVGPEVEDDAED